MLTGLIAKVYAEAGSVDASKLQDAIQINENDGGIDYIINLVLHWVLYIGTVLAFIYLVIAGITYLTAGGNAEQAKKGQTGVINAIIGIVIIALAWVILNAFGGSSGVANSGV